MKTRNKIYVVEIKVTEIRHFITSQPDKKSAVERAEYCLAKNGVNFTGQTLSSTAEVSNVKEQK